MTLHRGDVSVQRQIRPKTLLFVTYFRSVRPGEVFVCPGPVWQLCGFIGKLNVRVCLSVRLSVLIRGRLRHKCYRCDLAVFSSLVFNDIAN